MKEKEKNVKITRLDRIR